MSLHEHLEPGSNAGPAAPSEEGKFVPSPNLNESERREFEVVLELAGFTAEIKKMVVSSPGGAAAKAMFEAAIAALGTGQK